MTTQQKEEMRKCVGMMLTRLFREIDDPKSIHPGWAFQDYEILTTTPGEKGYYLQIGLEEI